MLAEDEEHCGQENNTTDERRCPIHAHPLEHLYREKWECGAYGRADYHIGSKRGRRIHSLRARLPQCRDYKVPYISGMTPPLSRFVNGTHAKKPANHYGLHILC
jgi:hypothetical protein